MDILVARGVLTTIKFGFVAHLGFTTRNHALIDIVAAASAVCRTRVAFHLSMSAIGRAIFMAHDFMATSTMVLVGLLHVVHGLLHVVMRCLVIDRKSTRLNSSH